MCPRSPPFARNLHLWFNLGRTCCSFFLLFPFYFLLFTFYFLLFLSCFFFLLTLFSKMFACKNQLRYSRERASQSLGVKLFICSFASEVSGLPRRGAERRHAGPAPELPTSIYLQKIGFDTAENEPLKVWGKIQFIFHSPP